MKTSVAYALAGCALACAAVTVVSLATTFWWFAEVTVPDISAAGHAVQAFMIIALLVLVATTFYCYLVAMKKAPPQAIPALFACAAVSAAIAMAVYTGEFTGLASYGYSFFLGWIAFGLDLALVPVSAVLANVSEYSVIP